MFMLISKITPMKKYAIQFFISIIAAGLFVSCDTEEDFDIPLIKEVTFFEGFESTTTGSGATEVPISLNGWSNYALNANGTRVWHSRTFSNNKYAEFSSFYSATTSTADEAWLVTPKITIDKDKNSFLSFETKVRFWTGSNVTVLISENYDGTKAGISTATWTDLNPTLPSSTTVDVFVPSGEINLAAYKGKSVNIAFKYIGSKTAGQTTTYQLDNIKLFEN